MAVSVQERSRELKPPTVLPIWAIIPIGESLFSVTQYKPFFENNSVDIIMSDVVWSGIAEAKQIAKFPNQYDVLITTRNC